MPVFVNGSKQKAIFRNGERMTQGYLNGNLVYQTIYDTFIKDTEVIIPTDRTSKYYGVHTFLWRDTLYVFGGYVNGIYKLSKDEKTATPLNLGNLSNNYMVQILGIDNKLYFSYIAPSYGGGIGLYDLEKDAVTHTSSNSVGGPGMATNSNGELFAPNDYYQVRGNQYFSMSIDKLDPNTLNSIGQVYVYNEAGNGMTDYSSSSTALSATNKQVYVYYSFSTDTGNSWYSTSSVSTDLKTHRDVHFDLNSVGLQLGAYYRNDSSIDIYSVDEKFIKTLDIGSWLTSNFPNAVKHNNDPIISLSDTEYYVPVTILDTNGSYCVAIFSQDGKVVRKVNLSEMIGIKFLDFPIVNFEGLETLFVVYNTTTGTGSTAVQTTKVIKLKQY